MKKDSRAQTSLEVLMVFGFVLVVALLIVLPYVSNQNITNASIVAKQGVLSFVEQNEKSVKISTIQPEVSGAFLSLSVYTLGEWDAQVQAELSNSGCSQICDSIVGLGAYSSVSFSVIHNNNSTAPLCFLSCP